LFRPPGEPRATRAAAEQERAAKEAALAEIERLKALLGKLPFSPLILSRKGFAVNVSNPGARVCRGEPGLVGRGAIG
jgi:hypothetical protein